MFLRITFNVSLLKATVKSLNKLYIKNLIQILYKMKL